VNFLWTEKHGTLLISTALEVLWTYIDAMRCQTCPGGWGHLRHLKWPWLVNTPRFAAVYNDIHRISSIAVMI